MRTPTVDDSVRDMVGAYARRGTRWYRLLRPPLPLVANARERRLPPASEGPCLLLGGAGQPTPPHFVNVDIVVAGGVNVVADGARLPFADGTFHMIECDAVLEHVPVASPVIAELQRVLRPGGWLHVVVPFNHPYHGYPVDFRRWTLLALQREFASMTIVDAGVRTGPAATWLLTTLQFVKLLIPGAAGKIAGAIAGWILWPVRYLDLYLYRTERAHVLANSIYVLARKPGHR